MNTCDYIILAVIALMTALIIAFIRKRHKQGVKCIGCRGCCSDCRKEFNTK